MYIFHPTDYEFIYSYEDKDKQHQRDLMGKVSLELLYKVLAQVFELMRFLINIEIPELHSNERGQVQKLQKFFCLINQ